LTGDVAFCTIGPYDRCALAIRAFVPHRPLTDTPAAAPGQETPMDYDADIPLSPLGGPEAWTRSVVEADPGVVTILPAECVDDLLDALRGLRAAGRSIDTVTPEDFAFPRLGPWLARYVGVPLALIRRKVLMQRHVALAMRAVYVTPKSYLSFIEGYKDLYKRKWTFIRELASSIGTGLQKMNEAKEDVNKLKVELGVKSQELAVAAKEIEGLVKSIGESTAQAEKEKQKVVAIVDAVSKKASEIAAVKDDAERDLAAAKPALDAAVSALNSITARLS
jgi:hypothetical protein